MLKSFTAMIGFVFLLPLTGCQTNSGVTDTGSAVPVTLKVLSFNIAGDSENWDTRKSACYDLINTHKPDIIGFQELLPENLKWALDNFPELRWYGPTIEGRPEAIPGDVEGESCRILYNAKRFSVDTTNSGAFWFSATPDVASEAWEDLRYCVYARLIDKNTGDGLYVFNTHWSYSSQGSRNQGAKLILDRIDTRAHPKDPFIVTGDFNARESDAGIQILLQRMTPILNNRVDWIFAESGKFERVNTEVISDINGAAISDHNVLLAELTISQ